MKTTISRYMKNTHGEDSYNLSEEIAVRAVFRTIRPDFLADHFNTAFAELSGDVYAQARFVDIGLRYENNLALNLAAARKIRVLLDEHKILMIPAYIETSAPEITGIVAAAIPTIRNPDPRRYFLERWMHHDHPEVARICRAALSDCPPETGTQYAKRPELNPVQANAQPVAKVAAQSDSRPAARPDTQQAAHRSTQQTAQSNTRRPRPAENNPGSPPKKMAAQSGAQTPARQIGQPNALHAVRPATKPNERPAAHRKSRPSNPQAAYRRISEAEAESFGYEKLIALIDRHITDPRPEIRLKWVKLIGHIPERLDPDDEHKMRFISIGLSDPVQDICLEAIAQIEFLIHDRSKLALLLKIIDSKSPLIRSKEAKTAIDTLTADSKKLVENRIGLPEKENKAEQKKVSAAARTGEISGTAKKSENALTGKKAEQSSAVDSGTRSSHDVPPKIAETVSAGANDANDRQSATGKDNEEEGQTIPRTDAVRFDGTPTYSAEEKAELSEIVEELDLPAEALAELERENTPSSLLIKEIAPGKPLQRTDNYFLRHSAVLHIKNIHEEELRFELYQTVLKHDPKDLVRQIAVEEARNLKREHVRPILRLGLADPAWQVRADAFEYLLPLLAGTEEEGQILRDCARDSDYHIRQKADEKLLTLSRRTAAP
jgi:hypothetical protein